MGYQNKPREYEVRERNLLHGLYGPEKFPRLLRKGPQASVVQKLVNTADENQQNQLSHPVDCTILTSNNWDKSCKLSCLMTSFWGV